MASSQTQQTPPGKAGFEGWFVVELREPSDGLGTTPALSLLYSAPVLPVYPRMLPRSRHPQKKGAGRSSPANRRASLWHLPDLGRAPKAPASGMVSDGRRAFPRALAQPRRAVKRPVVLSNRGRWPRGGRKPTGIPNTERGYRGLIGAVRRSRCPSLHRRRTVGNRILERGG